MNNNALRSTHPLILVAALSVTLFSFAGIAALMGWLPASRGQTAEPVAEASLQPAPEPAKPAPVKVVEKKVVEKVVRNPAPAPKLVVQARASAPTVHESPRMPPVYSEPARPGIYGEPARPVVAAAPVCHDCGRIETIRAIQQEGQPSGLGAVAGGVIGGILGHQVGGGRGRDLMTVVGAVGGAVAGHQVEKKTRATQVYEVVVRFDDGTTQRFTETEAPAWRIGDRVRVVDGRIRAATDV